MDRLQAMSTFVAVVDSGGFASAARKLNLSPPVVTRAVAELEERLGLRLLTRTTRVVRITDAGARYAEDCRRILAQIDEAEVAASGESAAARGTLTITAPVLFGREYVTPLVTQYLQRCPGVQANCLFLDRVVNLMEEGVDVAVRIGELPDSSLHATRVGRVRRVVVAAPAYLRQHGVPLRPADLAQHVIVAAGGITAAPEWRFVAAGKPLVQHVQPRLRTTTNDAALAATLAGFGLTRLMSYQVNRLVDSGALQLVLQEFENAPLPVHVLHLEGRRPTQKVRGFIDLVVTSLRADRRLQ